ncbi:hypothetical protein EW145_g7474 [Phellinidium pouzarii]|uniref:UDP-N-acetylglucosamine diphosphorylase n=1 Tax=Phellinidium pouzarii TaxID=167371 RepID=A0A4S4KIL6_9AGAM|nr:hypothetical protein EW145_g7474 [Phellinidium pouzarii]
MSSRDWPHVCLTAFDCSYYCAFEVPVSSYLDMLGAKHSQADTANIRLLSRLLCCVRSNPASEHEHHARARPPSLQSPAAPMSTPAALPLRPSKPPPAGPAPPAPGAAPPHPPTSTPAATATTAAPVLVPGPAAANGKAAAAATAAAATNGTSAQKGRKGAKADVPVDPQAMYESLKSKIAALEEELNHADEEELKFTDEAQKSVRGMEDNAVHTKYVELFAEMKRVERDHAKEKQKMAKDKDTASSRKPIRPRPSLKISLAILRRRVHISYDLFKNFLLRKYNTIQDNKKLRDEKQQLLQDVAKGLDEIKQLSMEITRGKDRARQQEIKSRELPDIVVKVVCKYRAELFFKISRKTKLSRLFVAWTERMESTNVNLLRKAGVPIASAASVGTGALPNGNTVMAQKGSSVGGDAASIHSNGSVQSNGGAPNGVPLPPPMSFLYTHQGRSLDPETTVEEAGIEDADEILAVELMDLTGPVPNDLGGFVEARRPKLKKNWTDNPRERVPVFLTAKTCLETRYFTEPEEQWRKSLTATKERLKLVLRQYELRERHFECFIRSKELELLLAKYRESEQRQLVEFERHRIDKLEEDNHQVRKELEEVQSGQTQLIEKLLQCCKEPNAERTQRLFTSLREELEKRAQHCSTMSSSRYETIKARYEAAQQAHVFTFWDTLSAAKQAALLDQLDSLDPARVNSIFHDAIAADEAAKHARADDIEPLPADVLDTVANAPEKEEKYRALGLEAIAAGRTAVLLMAGGQGTRLGSSAPKGCYDIGLPSHKSLFQVQAERILRLQTVAAQAAGKKPGDIKIRWYIMTSEPTHDATRAFFGWGTDGVRLDPSKPVNFGLAEDQVVFFKQGVLPCLSNDGKILLENPGKVAVAPDGNGGLYAALRTPLTQKNNNLAASSILSDLTARGTEFVHAYCVDNCLVKVADPVFIGACISHGAECGAKVVPKTHPAESVGVVARRAGHFVVVEYSEITPEQAERRDASGALALRAANIVNHFYTRAFLERTHGMEKDMAHHVARKQIPSVALPSGEQGKTAGLKLEIFVFDVFPFAARFAVLEGARTEEFSPLKNASGAKADTAETSRRDLLAQQRRFLEQAGATLAEGVEIELSPLLTYAGEGLDSVKGKTLTKSGHVETLKDLAAL